MTPRDTVLHFAALARSKADFMSENKAGFYLSCLKAGAHVGIGIILIFSLGQTIDPSIRSLVMGASFGIALTLVVFAGSDLFTGHSMYATFGRLAGTCRTSDVVKSWLGTWSGNLAGSFILAFLFVLGGGGVVLQDGGQDLLHQVAAKKMSAPPHELLARGILCNWLVCLALWTSARTKSDAAKCILIFWCLFAFIAAGFEHSVANMTVFSLALLSEHPATVSLSGAAYNLFWVTLGNIISGAIIMGIGYWLIAGKPRSSAS